MKKNQKLYILMKMEYGPGEENVFTEILNISSSRSTALTLKEHLTEEYADQIKESHDGRWVSIQLHVCGVQLDNEIFEDELFVRFIEGSSRRVKDEY